MALDTIDVWILKPKETYNQVTNPSFELATTGYTAVSSTIARVNTKQRRGQWSLAVTPNTGVAAGCYFGTVDLQDNITYTYSVDVLGVAGQQMRIEIRDTSANVLATKTFTATGYWQRPAVVYTETATASRRLYIIRDAVASTALWYVDGLQCEAGNESSYFDGSMTGYFRFRTDYRWLSTPHASQSWRSGQTKTGGELVKLSAYCTILTLIGLGMAPVQNISSPWRLYGSDYQTTIVNDRDFVIPVLFSGVNYSDMQADKKVIEDLVRPDAGENDQPLVVMFQVKNSLGVETSERCRIECLYESGLEGNTSNQRSEVAPLKFKAFLPLIMADGERYQPLTFQTSLATKLLTKRDTNGVWSSPITAYTGVIPTVRGVIQNPVNLNLYIFGNFATLNGVANTSGVAQLNGSTLTALGTGVGGSRTVLAAVLGPDGKLYVAGIFDNAGGVAAADYLAVWDGANWAAVGGVAPNGTVSDIKFAANGDMYITGGFTAVGATPANYIAKFSGGVWSALSTGLNGVGQVLEINNNDVYVGGTFTAAGGVACVNLAKWNGTAFSAIGTAVDDFVGALLYDRSKSRLYIGGQFSTFNGIATEGIGFWNGSVFISLSHGSDLGNKRFISKSTLNDTLYVGGDFTTINGNVLPDRLFSLRLNSFYPLDIDLPGAATVYDVFVDNNGYTWISSDADGTAIVGATNAIAIANNASSSRAYPRIIIKGPGTLWRIANESTGQNLIFMAPTAAAGNLTLLAGETVTLDLTPGKQSFVSDFRGKLGNYIAPGSNTDLYLQPGANDINVYMTGSTAATTVDLYWRDSFWGLAGAQQ